MKLDQSVIEKTDHYRQESRIIKFDIDITINEIGAIVNTLGDDDKRRNEIVQRLNRVRSLKNEMLTNMFEFSSAIQQTREWFVRDEAYQRKTMSFPQHAMERHTATVPTLAPASNTSRDNSRDDAISAAASSSGESSSVASQSSIDESLEELSAPPDTISVINSGGGSTSTGMSAQTGEEDDAGLPPLIATNDVSIQTTQTALVCTTTKDAKCQTEVSTNTKKKKKNKKNVVRLVWDDALGRTKEINSTFLLKLQSPRTYRLMANRQDDHELCFMVENVDIFSILVMKMISACTGQLSGGLGEFASVTRNVGRLLALRLTLLDHAKEVKLAQLDNTHVGAGVDPFSVSPLSSVMFAVDKADTVGDDVDIKNPMIDEAQKATHKSTSGEEWTSIVVFNGAAQTILKKMVCTLGLVRAMSVTTLDQLESFMDTELLQKTGKQKTYLQEQINDLVKLRPFIMRYVTLPSKDVTLLHIFNQCLVVALGPSVAAVAADIDDEAKQKAVKLSYIFMKQLGTNETLANSKILPAESVPWMDDFEECSLEEIKSHVSANSKPFLCEVDAAGNCTAASKDRRSSAAKVVFYSLLCDPLTRLLNKRNLISDDEMRILSFGLACMAFSSYRQAKYNIFTEVDLHLDLKDDNYIEDHVTVVTKALINEAYSALKKFQGDKLFVDLTEDVKNETMEKEELFAQYLS